MRASISAALKMGAGTGELSIGLMVVIGGLRVVKSPSKTGVELDGSDGDVGTAAALLTVVTSSDEIHRRPRSRNGG